MSHTNSIFTLDTAGRPIPATADQIIAAAREQISHRVRRGSPLSSPQATRDYLTLKLGTREFETFCCLFLDNRHRFIEFVELFRGTIDGAKEALRRNAAAVIFAHPHPSGVAEASTADELPPAWWYRWPPPAPMSSGARGYPAPSTVISSSASGRRC